MTRLIIQTLPEYLALELTAWGLHENQMEVDREESDDDSLPDYVSPVQEDRYAVCAMLANERDQGLSLPLSWDLDAMLSSEQIDELRAMLEQIREEGDNWQDCLADHEQIADLAFTARLED